MICSCLGTFCALLDTGEGNGMSNKIYGKCGYISLNVCTIMQTNTYILEYFHKQMNILDDAMGNLFFLISSLVAFERCNTHTYIAMYVYEFICMYICLYVCMSLYMCKIRGYVYFGVRCRVVRSSARFLSLQGRQFR